MQAALLMNNPVSKYPKFQAEIQDVFSNILCQPSPNILPANTRGNPYNIYTYNLYTMDELMNVLDNVGDLVCGQAGRDECITLCFHPLM